MTVWPTAVVLCGVGILLVVIASFFLCSRAQRDPKRGKDEYLDTVVMTRRTTVKRLQTETTESVEREP